MAIIHDIMATPTTLLLPTFSSGIDNAVKHSGIRHNPGKQDGDQRGSGMHARNTAFTINSHFADGKCSCQHEESLLSQ